VIPEWTEEFERDELRGQPAETPEFVGEAADDGRWKHEVRRPVEPGKAEGLKAAPQLRRQSEAVGPAGGA
jgi:hypothetical protein